MKDKAVILVVDDQSQNIELLEAYLVPQGYEIVKAAYGEEALEKLSDNRIDLILLDVMMPGMDGFEVTRRIRQDTIHRLLPVILVTSLRETEDRIKGIEAGCDDFISKPVDKMELLARVRSLLKVKDYNDLMSNYRKDLESEVTRRTKELSVSEVQYRRLFEAARDGILILDVETGMVVDVNPFLMEMLGFSREQFLGKKIWELGFFRDIAANKTHFLELRKKEYLHYEDVPLETADGRLIEVEFVSHVYLVDQKKVIQCNIRDITERIKAEKDRERLFQWRQDVNQLQYSLLESAPLDDKLKSVTDSIVRIFEADFCRIWLIRQGDLCERGCMHAPVKEGPYICRCRDECLHLSASSGRYTHRDGEGHRRVPLDCYMIGHIVSDHDRKYITNDVVTDPLVHNQTWARELGLVSFAGYRLNVPGGKTLGVMALFAKHPILSAEDAMLDGLGSAVAMVIQQAVAEEERVRLVTVIEQASEIIVITDVSGKILYVNPAFEKITGYRSEEAIGNNPHLLKSGKHDEVFYHNVWNTILGGEQWSGRFINKKKNGKLYIEEASITPIKDSSGAITIFAAVKRDVTNELLMERRIRETQKMEAIGTLAGGIAHDFNNILAAIIGYTELSLDIVPEDSQVHSDLTKIFRAGNRARSLINQILTFSRQREQEKRPISVAPIVRESLNLIRASLPSTIEIRREIESGLGTVLADPTQIHQIIMNLCTNAGHAMGEKGGILDVSLSQSELDSGFCLDHPGLIPGHYLKLMVSDTGHGIMPDISQKIFEPYFTTKEKSGGTGLGLSVVHGIVMDCGGTVTMHSEPGEGATFSVYLPIINEKPTIEAERKLSVEKGHERILFVDDEEDIVDVGKRILEQLGYTVTTIASSMDALELFQKDPYLFDLVITDMTMPFMSGDELSEEFMRIRQDIPIIVCTGYSEKLMEEKALSIGIRAYMGKPLLRSEMAETVRRVLDQQSEEV